MSIRILLADDHRVMRDGLRAVLAPEPKMQVVAEAGTGREVLDRLADTPVDVVVMDIGMPELNGIEATRQIVKQWPRVRVIALSTYSDKRYVLAMLDAGASAYVLKIAACEELLTAIRKVVRGECFLSGAITGIVVDSYVRRQFTMDQSAQARLGAREREVLQLVAEGKSSKEIAARLNVSVKTVETHRRNIMDKLDLRTVAELTKYAVREGISSLDD